MISYYSKQTSEKNYQGSYMQATFILDTDTNTYECVGDWVVLRLNGLTDTLQTNDWPKGQKITINLKKLTGFDSAGALMLLKYKAILEAKGNTVHLADLNKQQKDMLKMLDERKEAMEYSLPEREPVPVLAQIGEEAINKIQQLDGLVILIGDLSTKIFAAFGHLRNFQFPGIMSNIDSGGIRALPILALLSFLIGVVLAYQMGLQLETYGANNFIAYLSGMAIFREFGPLITAIIVAGRTSSAFTAQIGSMKVNEEIDALLTMGLSPTQLLVLPKVLGLVIVFPLLIFWSDFFSLLGSILMSQFMLGIYPNDFLVSLRDTVGLKQMMLGLYKAPVFAVLIALVGCFQGFRVEMNADSIGKQTTKSVVQALFLIIVADAIFSIIYSWMGV